jgi:spermidine/putrescine transport system substrate-binding protein
MPNVKIFNSEAQKMFFIDEEVTLGSAWNGHIYLAHQANPEINMAYPKEGFVISLDSMAIPKNAPHLENAYKFIDFILRAENAKNISETTGFSTPNQAALALMTSEIRNNPIIYPPEEIFKHGQFQTDVSANATALYEKYFQVLKLEKK